MQRSSSSPDVERTQPRVVEPGLVARSQAGDVEAIDELAARMRPVVERYAGRYVGDPARVEDLAQTVLMKAFARVGDVRAPEAFVRWLLSITRNECINELSRQRRVQTPLSPLDTHADSVEAPPGGEGDPEEALARTQVAALVREVAAGLPDHYGRTLTLRALEDRPYEEVAAALEVPVPVARLWYHRARRRFREAFVLAVVARRDVPVTCRARGAEIADLIEGTLPPGPRRALEDHLGTCAACRQTEDELRSTAFRRPPRALLAWPAIAGLRRTPGGGVRALGRVQRSAARLAVPLAGGLTLLVAGISPLLAHPGARVDAMTRQAHMVAVAPPAHAPRPASASTAAPTLAGAAVPAPRRSAARRPALERSAAGPAAPAPDLLGAVGQLVLAGVEGRLEPVLRVAEATLAGTQPIQGAAAAGRSPSAPDPVTARSGLTTLARQPGATAPGMGGAAGSLTGLGG